MPLLDRVATLIRANLNDLIDKAEDPEKLLKQLLLDMQNQFMQLKTQTAMAIAHQHLLETKRAENFSAQTEWLRKAEIALAHRDEALARAAAERSLSFESAASNYAQQAQDQERQVAILRESLAGLESKMAETRTQTDLLIARHHRARIALHTGASAFNADGQDTFDRMRTKISESEALGHGLSAMNDSGVQSKLDHLEKTEKVDHLLAELKRKRTAITE